MMLNIFATPELRLAPRRLRLLATVACAAALTACAPNTSDSELERYVAEVKARPSAPIPPIPEMKPFMTFVYPENVERDPFAVPVAEQSRQQVATGPSPDQARPREALEDYPLDSLRMMGTLQQNNRLWALIRDPEGTIHRVEAGNYVGQNHGKVVRIADVEVALVELVPNGRGGWMERAAALAVQQ